LNTSVDLYAQVKGTTVSTYSWTTSGNFTGTALTGTSAYHVHFQWPGTQASAQVESITLTVTDTSSHQESETIDFQVPTSNIVTMPSSASWPVTIPPDLVQPGAPAFDSQGVSVDAISGALDTSIDLPSYNPNVPVLSLVYNSLTADPRPIVVVHHTLDDTKTVPTKVDATLTFNGSAGTKWVYDTSQFIAGDVQQMALQANATSLSTGRYSYSVQIIDERSSNTTLTYTGTATVLNQSTSAVGDGWTIQGLEQVIPAGDSSGVILSLGDNGESLWFAGNPGVGGSYTTPAGDFSTLTKTSSGYTRTLPDGTQITFNSSGYQTATIDLNSLHVTFAYNGSNQLTTVQDPYGNSVTLTYSSGKLSTIQDPAGRLATFTFSGNNLQAVKQADGSLVTFSYDGSGRMTQVKDQRANTVTIAYDSIERASTITRPDGTTQLFSAYQEQGWTNSGTSGSPAASTLLAEAVTNYTTPAGNTLQTRPDWMGLGRLGQATDAFGNVFSNDPNANGLPIVSVDGLNRITQATYDSLGNPVTIAYPDLATDHYTYNSDSEPLTHTDGNGHTTSMTYDGEGNLTSIKDPLSNLTTLTYTANGQIQTIKDANGKTTSIQYDSQDRATTVQFPDGTTNLYSYNSQGNVTKVTDGRSNATTYLYDALNRLTGSTDALNNLTTLTLDGAGNVTKIQAPTPAGQTARTTTFAYDSMNRVTTVVDPLGNQSVVGYDADGNESSFKDPLGRVTTTQYDAMDNPVVVIDPMGNHVTATFDADGEKLTVTDSLNRTTTYSYSVRGWLAMITDPLGFLTTITYTPTGKQSGTYKTAGSLLETSALTYDAADRLQSRADGMNDLTTFSYDGVGNVTAVKDANNNTISYVYDSRNRVTTVTDALGHSTVIGFDGSGNQQTVTDPLGHTATVLFDALDRATTLISAISGTTTIVFDAAGREISLTDPVGNRTQWAYDSNDRLTTLTQPNNATVTYVYDAAGELTDTTDADGRRTTLAYDPDGAQTGETWVGASPAEKITYTFDAAHQLTKVADSFATLTFVYDNDSRLTTQVTSGPGTGQPTVTLTYSYDQLGEETSVTDSLSSQGITTYSYDNAQRMNKITTNYGGAPQVSLSYDPANRLTSTSRQIGSSSTAAQVNTTIVYDAANRMVTVTHGYSTFGIPSWTTTPLATQVYSYDSANRLSSETDAEGTASFSYDNANELTGVTGSRSESYSYDSNGNRTGSGWSTTVMNEVATSPGPITYTFDNAGNMITSKTGSTTTTFTYDFRNRLTGVNQGGTLIATYVYNALDQRIGAQDSGTQTWTVYDGQSPDANPYADFNGSRNLTMRYLFGPGVVNGAVTSVILARTTSGGTTAWYLTDKLGSVRDIVSTTGTVIDHIVYDSFGNIVTETNGANGDRFKFAGMHYDAAIAQQYDHARSYGSGIGRFLSQDPLAFGAGSTNLYSYVNDSPTDVTDMSGLEPPPPPPVDVNAGIKSLVANKPFMTALRRDPCFGPLIAKRLADPTLINKIVLTPALGPRSEFDPRTGIIRLGTTLTMEGIELAIVHEVAHERYLWHTGDDHTSLYNEFYAFYYETMAYQYGVGPLGEKDMTSMVAPDPSRFWTRGIMDPDRIVTWLNLPDNPYRLIGCPTYPPGWPKLGVKLGYPRGVGPRLARPPISLPRPGPPF
jgi:RHS repeat-associated protein